MAAKTGNLAALKQPTTATLIFYCLLTRLAEAISDGDATQIQAYAKAGLDIVSIVRTENLKDEVAEMLEALDCYGLNIVILEILAMGDENDA